MSAEHFHQPFKIQAFPKVPADAYLPVAHTCFFSLELPRYSSREVKQNEMFCRMSDSVVAVVQVHPGVKT